MRNPLRSTGRLLTTIAVSAPLLLLLLLPACARTAAPPGEPTPTPTPTTEPSPSPDTPAEQHDVLLYLVRGEKLGVVSRSVSDTSGIAASAMRALLSGATRADSSAGLSTQIPQGTRLNSVRVDDGRAIVDVSEEFESGGGSASMQLRVAQVVYTLTQFASVRTVSFEIEGRSVDSIGGEGVLVSPPLGRADLQDNVLPPIFVESPTPYQVVEDPLRLEGMSNTFEATFVYNLLDRQGTVIRRDFVTATAGTGTWGAFCTLVPFEITRSGEGKLVVFEESAEDGSRINVVEIPVRLSR